MEKLILLSALLIFACSSELFCQDYMKMNKKNLRLEYQKKLNQIDSLKQVLDLTYSENQNLQSNLNNANNNLLSISDSLKNSNFEISQLEAKLLNSKNELSQLGLEIDNLVKQNSDNLDLITDKNLQIDSLRTSLNIASEEKIDLISQDSLNNTIISGLEKDYEILLIKLNNKISVIIGDQVWTNENLSVSEFRNGDLIIESKTDEEWYNASNKKQPTWRYYNFDENYSYLGKFYNYYAVSDPRNIAPKGWRVPIFFDYLDLIINIKPNVSYKDIINNKVNLKGIGGALKIKGFWGNYCVNNTTGFNAIPYSDNYGNKIAYYWCITNWNDIIDLVPEKDKEEIIRDIEQGDGEHHKAIVFRIRDGINCIADFDDDPKGYGYNLRLIKE